MRTSSDIYDLRVMHWRNTPGRCTLPDCQPGSFVVDTCLRRVCIDMSGKNVYPAGAEQRSGAAAYQFLLEVTTGLHSEVPGETNIFGQFKKAWLSYQRMHSAAHLAPIVHRLFDDTKAIRRNHLEGIGGSSYGGLVRKLIDPQRGERILFVGAGALAQSMLPLFSNHVLGIWNHRDIEMPTRHVERAFRPDEGNRAACWADHVILTTPPDKDNDRNWDAWLGATSLRSVVRLGHRGSRQTTVKRPNSNASTACFDLGDVFALRRAQDYFRADQLHLARAACRSLARVLAAGTQRVSIQRPVTKRLIGEHSISEPDLALA